MHFENDSPKPSIRHSLLSANSQRLKSVEEETQESSEEISEEEEDDEDDEEFKRIKDMEEKYLQLNSGKVSKESAKTLLNLEKEENDHELLKQNENKKQKKESESESDNETEEEEQEQEEVVTNEGNMENTKEENLSNDNNETSELNDNNEIQAEGNLKPLELLDQNNLMEILQNSLNDLKISPLDNNPDNIIMNAAKSILANESDNQTLNIKNLNPETIALALVNALKESSLKSKLSSLNNPQSLNQLTIPEIEEDDNDNQNIEISSNDNQNQINEEKYNEIEHYQDDYEQEEEVDLEAEDQRNADHVADAGSVDYDDRDIYYDAHFDYRITSKTPTSFNSDEYIFHANFIKQFQRTSSTDKLR